MQDESPDTPPEQHASTEAGVHPSGEDDSSSNRRPASKLSDDWLAIVAATILLVASFGAVWASSEFVVDPSEASDTSRVEAVNPLKNWIAKPSKWTASPMDAFVGVSETGAKDATTLWGVVGAFAALATLLSCCLGFREGAPEAAKFFKGFVGVFLLAAFAYLLAGHSVVKAYNLEYALWALMVGLIISNTIGTPTWMKPAVLTEFFIKTGLVLLGAEVLMSRLLLLGIPGIAVAWIVTPTVLICTYLFGQKVLRMESKSLNMVIAADMSVCGVSAAIAAAAACKAKKEELSLAIGMSLSFTVVMMIVLPIMIRLMGLGDIVGGAWLGGTIDATGAVAVAGAALGDRALEVAATVKMIQNILIGASAFGIAAYWVTRVENDPDGNQVGISEIWTRFPRFVLGFIAMSILFSLLHSFMVGGAEMVGAMIKGSTKTFRGWFFCLAFVSIGLETKFSELAPYFKGGKPLALYLCGQTLNLILTLAMAYLMFGVLFKDYFAP
jgi:uncharacterized membrane protein YadS